LTAASSLSDNEDGLAKPNRCFNTNPMASAAAEAQSGLCLAQKNWIRKKRLKAGARPPKEAFDVVIAPYHALE